MPARKVGLPNDVPKDLADGLAAIRATMEVREDFEAPVLAAAEQAAAGPVLPDLDRTDIELITIDPAGSRDLDQAMHLTRRGLGFSDLLCDSRCRRIRRAGRAVDLEAHRRGMTLYAPDRRIPLHPLVLSEGAASLLPDQVRPALLWTITLDAQGQMTDAEVARARVRSREQLTYEQAQSEIDGGSPRETLALLKEVGKWRQQRERDRGGVSLEIPEQEIDPPTDDHGWQLRFRAPLPAEGWNAQISLLTGTAAAHIMLYGQVGILRTMPPADHESLRRLHQTAKALKINWPAELDYPEFVRSLDPSRAGPRSDDQRLHTPVPRGRLSRLQRGDPRGRRARGPGDRLRPRHRAPASAGRPVCRGGLRRALRRWPVPIWVLRALDALPEEMAVAERRAKKYERAIIDLMEVCLLRDRAGETFTATVIEVDKDKRRGVVMITDPAVEARVRGNDLPLGHEIQVRLTSADLATGALAFDFPLAPARRFSSARARAGLKIASRFLDSHGEKRAVLARARHAIGPALPDARGDFPRRLPARVAGEQLLTALGQRAHRRPAEGGRAVDRTGGDRRGERELFGHRVPQAFQQPRMSADRPAEHEQFGIVDGVHGRHGDDEGPAERVDPHPGRRVVGPCEVENRAYRPHVERGTVRPAEALADQRLQHRPGRGRSGRQVTDRAGQTAGSANELITEMEREAQTAAQVEIAEAGRVTRDADAPLGMRGQVDVVLEQDEGVAEVVEDTADVDQAFGEGGSWEPR